MPSSQRSFGGLRPAPSGRPPPPGRRRGGSRVGCPWVPHAAVLLALIAVPTLLVVFAASPPRLVAGVVGAVTAGQVPHERLLLDFVLLAAWLCWLVVLFASARVGVRALTPLGVAGPARPWMSRVLHTIARRVTGRTAPDSEVARPATAGPVPRAGGWVPDQDAPPSAQDELTEHVPQAVLVVDGAPSGVAGGTCELGAPGHHIGCCDVETVDGCVSDTGPDRVDRAVRAGMSETQVAWLDQVLHDLAATMATGGAQVDRPGLPEVAAVEIADEALVLHLAQPCRLPSPWHGTTDRRHWMISHHGRSDVEPGGPADSADSARPAGWGSRAGGGQFPLLFTLGTDGRGHVWMVNAGVTSRVRVTGDRTRGTDLLRHVVAELAAAPWSGRVAMSCTGLGSQVCGFAPERITATHTHMDPRDGVVDDADGADGHARSAEAVRVGVTLTWRHGEDRDPGDTLQVPLTAPARSGVSIVLDGEATQAWPGELVLEVTPDGLVHVPGVLTVTAVGLTAAEARACLDVLTAVRDTHSPAPPGPSAPDEPSPPAPSTPPAAWTTSAGLGILPVGAGRARTAPDSPAFNAAAEHTVERRVELVEHTDRSEAGPVVGEPPGGPCEVGPGSGRDRCQAAPSEADPSAIDSLGVDTLDADLAEWHALDCPRPRLSVLGPVRARTRGRATAVASRRAYFTALLTFLATRANGATGAEVAEAFAVAPASVRSYLRTLRAWLGTDPGTGAPHVPEASRSAAAARRGVPAYEVQGLLTDADLFTRLVRRAHTRTPTQAHTRTHTRTPDDRQRLADLVAALALVQGVPFDGQGRQGWAWLSEGDRLDQQLAAQVLAAAHEATTIALACGDLAAALAAAQAGVRAAPTDQAALADLDTVTAAITTTHATGTAITDGEDPATSAASPI